MPQVRPRSGAGGEGGWGSRIRSGHSPRSSTTRNPTGARIMSGSATDESVQHSTPPLPRPATYPKVGHARGYRIPREKAVGVIHCHEEVHELLLPLRKVSVHSLASLSPPPCDASWGTGTGGNNPASSRTTTFIRLGCIFPRDTLPAD